MICRTLCAQKSSQAVLAFRRLISCYSIWKASSISHFLNVISCPIMTSAHLVSTHAVIIQHGYLETCTANINGEFPGSTEKGRKKFAFCVCVILKSILFRQQLYITSGELEHLKPLTSTTKRKRACLSSTVSTISVGFICLFDNTQHDSVISFFSN